MFRVGQKVVCVDAKPRNYPIRPVLRRHGEHER